MNIEVLSISIHEMAELLREGIRAKGIDPGTLVVESYQMPRMTVTFDGKTDEKGRLVHKVEMERALVHWTYHEPR